MPFSSMQMAIGQPTQPLPVESKAGTLSCLWRRTLPAAAVRRGLNARQDCSSNSTASTRRTSSLCRVTRTDSSSSASSSGRLAADDVFGKDSNLNKVPVAFSMSTQLYSYLLNHTREHEVLAILRQETTKVTGAHMQITPEQGAFLTLLAELMGVRRAVEVGVFTGYSALAVALALPPGGRLYALDKDKRTMEIAQRHWEMAGVSDKVVSMVGPALDSLKAVLESEGQNSIDLVFIDADKRAYEAYYELALQLVLPGGLIIFDNVLFHGKVADPAAVATDKATAALTQLNAKLLKDDRVSLSILPVGDGMALCRKR